MGTSALEENRAGIAALTHDRKDAWLNLCNGNMPLMKPCQCVFNLIQFSEYSFPVVLNNTHSQIL